MDYLQLKFLVRITLHRVFVYQEIELLLWLELVDL